MTPKEEAIKLFMDLSDVEKLDCAWELAAIAKESRERCLRLRTRIKVLEHAARDWELKARRIAFTADNAIEAMHDYIQFLERCQHEDKLLIRELEQQLAAKEGK